jgi:tricorn protease
MEQESALVMVYYLIYKQNGSKIALASNWNGNYDIWIVSVSGGEPKQLTFHESNDDLAC